MKRPKNNLLNALTRIAEHRPQPFIAPIPSRIATILFSLQDNIPYFFRLTGEVQEGWFEVTPVSKNQARISRLAYVFEVMEYLDQLPRFQVINCFPVGGDKALVVPYNQSDASQRGWQNGEPRTVHLCRHPNAIENPFRVLTVRNLAGILIYDQESWNNAETRIHIDLLHNLSCNCGQTHEIPRHYLNAWEIVLKRHQELKELELQEKLKLQELTLEEQLQFKLSFVGAKLNTWRELPQGYQITWTIDGREFTQSFNKELRCTVPGLCLHNVDNYDLSSIVNTMQEAVKLNRPFFNQDNDYEEDD